MPLVEQFRTKFFAFTESFTFDFIDSPRLASPPESEEGEQALIYAQLSRQMNPKARPPKPPETLAGRVARFVRDAQVNRRRFFSTTEPDLFTKILRSLTARRAEIPNPADLLRRLERIRESDSLHRGLGLNPDVWNFPQLQDFLTKPKRSERYKNALIVLGSYVDVLDTRSAERQLVADRLSAFVHNLNGFLLNKKISLNQRKGIVITSGDGTELREDQLSSGEYNLLHLMVAALITRRRGTVIAIDEPEMSMHIAWQRKLIRSLFACASNAEPQFIFATHSPDIATEYPDALVRLGPSID